MSMNRLYELIRLLSSALPGVKMSIDRVSTWEDSPAWIALKGLSQSMDIEYLPAKGIGLHLGDDEGFGSGPNETFQDPKAAVTRVLEIWDLRLRKR
jgi:hypothetical protein